MSVLALVVGCDARVGDGECGAVLALSGTNNVQYESLAAGWLYVPIPGQRPSEHYCPRHVREAS